MGGLLSQALANLEAAEQQINALAGLPPEAQTVQSSSASVIREIESAVAQVQTTVAGFARDVAPHLHAADASLASNDHLAQIRSELVVAQQQATELKRTVDESVTGIGSKADTVAGCATTLARIQSELCDRMAALEGKLNTTRGEVAAAQKKYYYLLGLGSLGVPGLAVAAALYTKWNSDLNDLQSQASSLSSQIARLRMMNAATQQLGADFQSVQTKTSGLKNAVEFLSGNLDSVMADIDGNGNRTTIRIAVQAALTEVSTLATDAS